MLFAGMCVCYLLDCLYIVCWSVFAVCQIVVFCLFDYLYSVCRRLCLLFVGVCMLFALLFLGACSFFGFCVNSYWLDCASLQCWCLLVFVWVRGVVGVCCGVLDWLYIRTCFYVYVCCILVIRVIRCWIAHTDIDGELW